MAKKSSKLNPATMSLAERAKLITNNYLHMLRYRINLSLGEKVKIADWRQWRRQIAVAKTYMKKAQAQ